MALSAEELYELLLALAPPRLDAARRALSLRLPAERARELEAALVPLAVDAALLGIEGMSALARAIAAAADAPRSELEAALDLLERATSELGHGDASGARAEESLLVARAESLRRAAEPPPPGSAPSPAPEELELGGIWRPELGEDLVAAFLDECSERLDGLSERLMLLEQRGSDPALVAEIFRDLHTLKGSSGFAGLKAMNRIAHLAEDRMGELREGKRSCDRALIDVLLETLDALRTILDRARRQQPIELELGPLLARLRDPSAPAVAVEAAPALSPAATRPAETAPVQATLRIDFAKVDLLLNLVGEAVLARGRLTAAAEMQTALVRELAQLRNKLTQLASDSPLPKRRSSEAIGELGRIERVLVESHDEVVSGLGGLTLAVGQLRDHVMKLRMVPIARLFSKYQRTVRELSQSLGKQVVVELGGAETELDKVLVERLEDPLLHLVRNAIDHGIELPAERIAAGKPPSGTLGLGAVQQGGQIVVTIRDDGRGMSPLKLRAKAVERGLLTQSEAEALSHAATLELIFRPGFSTAETVSDLSGRGVGMDVVRDAIAKLKGTIALDSEPGKGTTIELRLPLTLAITQVLVARLGQELVAIPLDAVVSAQRSPESFELVAGAPCLRVADELLPVIDLGRLLGLDQEVALQELADASVVLVAVGTEQLALLVDQVLGRHEVVIKSLGPLLTGTPFAAGATLLGDRVLLVLDLLQVAAQARQPLAARSLCARPERAGVARARILVAEDSDLIRQTVQRELEAAGFEVRVAKDGLEALGLARRESFDLVSTDVLMPGIDGFELTRALRQEPQYQKVPIVIVTSKDSRIDALRGFDAGADAYLTKPADVGELIRTIEGLLERTRHRSSRRSASDPTSEPAP